MSDNIKTKFTIKDLENLSGIKAHTIRIWEKRYALLSPERTDTNIRYYDVANLQKLLNVKLLSEHDYKISKIAALTEEELKLHVKEIIARQETDNYAVNDIKLAMVKFDQQIFELTFNRLKTQKTFSEIFKDVIIPLLFDIGNLWQSGSIQPAHEHFITNLIEQKLHSNIERLQVNPPAKSDEVFVLYLPMNEIHEIGILYLHYELILRSHHSIYLGQSVPAENLKMLQDHYDNIRFISYFTVQPAEDALLQYVEDFSQQILSREGDSLWLLGYRTKSLQGQPLPERVNIYDSVEKIIEKIA